MENKIPKELFLAAAKKIKEIEMPKEYMVKMYQDTFECIKGRFKELESEDND